MASKENGIDAEKTATVREVNIWQTTHVRRNLGALSIIALSFNICNGWVGVGGGLALSIGSGGTVTMIYGVIVACFVYLSVAISLAELASVYPTAGGQYHFTYLLAPDACKRGLSYTCGSIAIFSWVFCTASAAILSSEAILSIVLFFNASYDPPPWHYFLVYQAVNLVFLLYNILALKRTPWIHDVGCKHPSIHPLIVSVGRSY